MHPLLRLLPAACPLPRVAAKCPTACRTVPESRCQRDAERALARRWF
jgi:hypothetical protein